MVNGVTEILRAILYSWGTGSQCTHTQKRPKRTPSYNLCHVCMLLLKQEVKPKEKFQAVWFSVQGVI